MFLNISCRNFGEIRGETPGLRLARPPLRARASAGARLRPAPVVRGRTEEGLRGSAETRRARGRQPAPRSRPARETSRRRRVAAPPPRMPRGSSAVATRRRRPSAVAAASRPPRGSSAVATRRRPSSVVAAASRPPCGSSAVATASRRARARQSTVSAELSVARSAGRPQPNPRRRGAPDPRAALRLGAFGGGAPARVPDARRDARVVGGDFPRAGARPPPRRGGGPPARALGPAAGH